MDQSLADLVVAGTVESERRSRKPRQGGVPGLLDKRKNAARPESGGTAPEQDPQRGGKDRTKRGRAATFHGHAPRCSAAIFATSARPRPVPASLVE